MKSMHVGALVICAALSLAPAQSAKKQNGDSARLIGAWHLVHIESPGANATEAGVPQPKGMLIYSQDGHFSVQLMYPKSEQELNNQYVRDGYEASFGSYEVDDASHTLIHHVQGSNTGDRIVGKDLKRIYQLTKDGRLIIRPAQSDEHWSVVWKRY